MYLKKVFWQEKEFLPEKFLLLYRLTILVKNRKTIALARVYKPKHLTKDYYAYYFLSDGFLVHRKEHDAGTAAVLIRRIWSSPAYRWQYSSLAGQQPARTHFARQQYLHTWRNILQTPTWKMEVWRSTGFGCSSRIQHDLLHCTAGLRRHPLQVVWILCRKPGTEFSIAESRAEQWRHDLVG